MNDAGFHDEHYSPDYYLGSLGLDTHQLQSLKPAQITALNADQLKALADSSASGASLADLTDTQVAAISTAAFSRWGDFFHDLTTWQLAALTSQQIKAFSPDQMRDLTTAEIQALTGVHFAAFNSRQLQALDATQIAAIEPEDLARISSQAIRGFTAEALAAGLSTEQMAQMSMTQVGALTSAQIAALSPDQRNELYDLTSPLVLDLSGNGLNISSLASTVSFDINADGVMDQVAWIGEGSAFLALDRNGDGVINNGGELFGTASVLSSGLIAADGFVALQDFDTNDDGLIDVQDSAFNALRLWQDSNFDGVSTPDEMYALDSLGVASINVTANQQDQWLNQSHVGLVGTYTLADGTHGEVADVWLAGRLGDQAPPVVSPEEPHQSNEQLLLVPKLVQGDDFGW